MTFVVKPSRNKIVQAAFAGLRAAQRAEGKSAKHSGSVCELAQVRKSVAKPAPAKKKAAKPSAKRPSKKKGKPNA